MKVLIDNCVINNFYENDNILSKLLSVKGLVEFYICPSTIDEFSKIKDDNIEKRIISLYSLFQLEPKYIYDSVCVPDYSRFDFCALGKGKVYKELLSTKTKNYKHIRDAIIADTAVSNSLILLTEDNKLKNAMHRLGYPVVAVSELVECVKKLK